jgi:hypothetical protein
MQAAILKACWLRFFPHYKLMIVSAKFAAADESLHKLADLTDAAEFEAFKEPSRIDFPPDSKPPEPYVRHRLRSRLPFWQAICTSSCVLGIITVEYMLPWIAGPPLERAHFSNHASAFQHSPFVNEAVANLGLISASTTPQVAREEW